MMMACGDAQSPATPTAVPTPAEREMAVAATAASTLDETPRAPATSRGYRAVNLSLPRLHHEGGLWHLDDRPLEYVPPEDRREEVVLQAKMVLDDSLPRRQRFWAAPHFDGCVDKHERRHRGHWVRVILPPGQSVQVTDQRLYIQGRLAASGPDGRMTFDAVAVQPQRSVVDPRLSR